MGAKSWVKNRAKSFTKNPIKFAGNALWDGTLKGGGLGYVDKAMGGSGSLGSTLGNPLMQAGAGAALSFSGMPWAMPAALGLGAGMGFASSGDLDDALQGASIAGLGYGAGSLGQAGFSGAQGMFAGAPTMGSPAASLAAAEASGGAAIGGASAGVTAGGGGEIMGGADFMAGSGTTASMGGGEVMGGANFYPATTSGGTLGAGSPGMGMDFAGGAGPQYSTVGNNISMGGDLYDVNPAGGTDFNGQGASRASRVVGGGASVARAGLGGGGGMTGNQMLGLMGAKTGIGYLSNLQAQKALEPELEARRRAMERIRQLQENPGAAYRNDPALRAMRSRALDTVESRYRSKYGGGEGGAFARDLARTGAGADRAALNDALSSEYQMLGMTSPAQQQNMGAGGTGLGALTGSATGAMSDYALMQFLNNL